MQDIDERHAKFGVSSSYSLWDLETQKWDRRTWLFWLGWNADQEYIYFMGPATAPRLIFEWRALLSPVFDGRYFILLDPVCVSLCLFHLDLRGYQRIDQVW